jgi:DNA-binding NtrC family response regulator
MLLGKDPILMEVVQAAKVVAATDVNTLIHGESGTGKELLARFVHDNSPREARSFISVNCAALPEALAESLLFGHKKGAFTGATDDHEGYIRAAAGGTLFLDEIAELSAAVQAKLLRFLESGEVLPVGVSVPQQVDVRVIAATHQDLQQKAAAGDFREDLFYRLNVVPLWMPSLRERQSDIPLLLKTFLGDFSSRHGLESPRFSRASLSLLKQYHWPGNVRELRNLCERLTVLLPGREIAPQNLPREFQGKNGSPQDLIELPAQGLVLSEVEKSLIQQALERTHGNRSRAARLLGISRDTLLYRLKKFALT